MQTNILDWLEATSARCPDAPAVGDDQTDCTWAQLADTARRAGSFLASRTMPRRPVAFYLEKSVSAFHISSARLAISNAKSVSPRSNIVFHKNH